MVWSVEWGGVRKEEKKGEKKDGDKWRKKAVLLNAHQKTKTRNNHTSNEVVQDECEVSVQHDA